MHQPLDMKKFVPWIIYIIFFGVLNETVFNVSTPKIAEQYDLSATGVSWVVTVFIITFGIGSVVYGKLADILSVRKLISIGIGIYVAGAIIGFAMQPWYEAVIIGRAVQGAGASAIPALVMVVVARYFTPEDRSKLFGILTSTSSFAIGIGPVIGGFISAYAHWSVLFLVALFTLGALPAFRRLLPIEQDRNGSIDVTGALLMGIAVVALVVWCTDPRWTFIAIFAVAVVLFIWRIRKTREPFVEPAMFANRLYSAGLVVGFLLFGSIFATLFTLPLMLNGVYDLNTDRIGIIMFPGAFSAVIFGTIAGRLCAKRGSHFVAYAGLLMVGAALLFITGLVDNGPLLIAILLVPMYIGFSFVQTALGDSIAQIVPVERMGIGMGFYGLVLFIAGAVGTAAVAQLLGQSWAGRKLLPLIQLAEANVYGNLIFASAMLILLSGILFGLSLGRAKTMTKAHSSAAQH